MSSPQGFVKNLWSAFAAIAKAYPKGEFTFGTWTGSGFYETTEPIGVSLFRPEQRGPSWSYVSPHNGSSRRFRQYYLASVRHKGSAVYFLELERRVKRSKDGSGHETEQFRGFAFQLADNARLGDVLTTVLVRTVDKLGRFDEDIPGTRNSLTYKHTFDSEHSLSTTVTRVLSRFIQA